MSLGVEQDPYIGVPGNGEADRPPLDVRFYFRNLSGDRVEVHHPFHGVVTLGDGSAIDNDAADAAGVVLFQKMPFLIDSKKLNRPREFETRPSAGEYAELSHCFSLGMLGQVMGGGPMDILDGFYNDTTKTHNGHQSDDNYQGHGLEDLHDAGRADFLERAGILEAFEEAGVVVREKSGLFVAKTRLSLDTLLDEDEVTVRRSFLSNKHKARRSDADRWQYSEEEALLLRTGRSMDSHDPGRVPLALARVSIDAIARKIVLHDDEGDQFVFKEAEPALEHSMMYAEHNSEHWCEPVQDFINDILNLAERYFFICDHPLARQFQDFYPRDYLHTSASLMYERYKKVAEDDPAMAWFLDVARTTAADQRHKAVKYERNFNPYAGPNPPEGMTLEKLPTGHRVESVARVEGNCFIIDLPRGKMRTINPRVLNGGGQTRALTEIYPEYADFCNDRHAWIGDYRAEITIDDPGQARAVARALQLIEEHWQRAVSVRPEMPASELRHSIAEANKYVYEHGIIKLG